MVSENSEITPAVTFSLGEGMVLMREEAQKLHGIIHMLRGRQSEITSDPHAIDKNIANQLISVFITQFGISDKKARSICADFSSWNARLEVYLEIRLAPDQNPDSLHRTLAAGGVVHVRQRVGKHVPIDTKRKTPDVRREPSFPDENEWGVPEK